MTPLTHWGASLTARAVLFALLVALIGIWPDLVVDGPTACVDVAALQQVLVEQSEPTFVHVSVEDGERPLAEISFNVGRRLVGQRRLSADDCSGLQNAIALHLSLALAAQADNARAPLQSVNESARSIEPQSVRWLTWRVHAAASALVGATPTPAAGGEILFELVRAPFSARGGAQVHHTLTRTTDVDVAATRAALALGACWEAWSPLQLCASSAVGFMTSSSPRAQRSSASPVADVQLRAYLSGSPARYFGAGAFVVLAVNLAQTRLFFDGRDVWHSPLAWGGVGFDTFFDSE